MSTANMLQVRKARTSRQPKRQASPLAARRGWNALHSSNALARLVFIRAAYSASVKSTVGLRMLKPTLETRMSTRPPKRRDASATSDARDAASETSQTAPETRHPRAVHSRTAESTSEEVRAHV